MSNGEMQKVKRQNKQLKEENNLLKLKIELLMDMVRALNFMLPSLLHSQFICFVLAHREHCRESPAAEGTGGSTAELKKKRDRV